MRSDFGALGVSLPEGWSHHAVKRSQQVWETSFNHAPGMVETGLGIAMGSDAAI